LLARSKSNTLPDRNNFLSPSRGGVRTADSGVDNEALREWRRRERGSDEINFIFVSVEAETTNYLSRDCNTGDHMEFASNDAASLVNHTFAEMSSPTSPVRPRSAAFRSPSRSSNLHSMIEGPVLCGSAIFDQQQLEANVRSRPNAPTSPLSGPRHRNREDIFQKKKFVSGNEVAMFSREKANEPTDEWLAERLMTNVLTEESL